LPLTAREFNAGTELVTLVLRIFSEIKLELLTDVADQVD